MAAGLTRMAVRIASRLYHRLSARSIRFRSHLLSVPSTQSIRYALYNYICSKSRSEPNMLYQTAFFPIIVYDHCALRRSSSALVGSTVVLRPAGTHHELITARLARFDGADWSNCRTASSWSPPRSGRAHARRLVTCTELQRRSATFAFFGQASERARIRANNQPPGFRSRSHPKTKGGPKASPCE